MKYSIIIVSYKYDLTPCLESIEKHSTDHEVIIIDNNEINRGFACACNLGAKQAKGDYLVFLNPDTIVSPNWLGKMREKCLPGVGAVGPVSDYVAGLQKAEIYTNPQPIKINPCDSIIPEYGDTVETDMLIGFCLMMHKTVFNQIGGMDETLFLGNDDLDLSWRLKLQGYKLIIATDVFIHHEGQQSFKSNPKANQLVQDSTDALHRKMLNYYHGNPPPMVEWFKPRKVVSIIILCWNQFKYTKECIVSIINNTGYPYELILVDNGSTDETVEYLKNFTKTITNPINYGVARGWNQGIWKAIGDYVLVLNNDTIVTPGWLKSMVELSESDEDIGIVGPRSNNISGPQQIDNLTLNSKEDILKLAEIWNSAKLQPFECHRIVGFCMLIKRKALNKIGLFDEQFGMGNYEDDDYCLRSIRAGFKNVVCNQSFVYHYRSKSYDDKSVDWLKLMEENKRKFEEKWNS